MPTQGAVVIVTNLDQEILLHKRKELLYMEKACPSCGQPVGRDALFCPYCGNTYFPWQSPRSQGAIGYLLLALALAAAFDGGWMLLLALFVGGLGLWLLIPKGRNRL